MGLGRHKDHCTVGEKEVQKCKKKKCCAEPKMVQLINNYLQNEMSHTLEEDSQQLLKTTKKSRAVIQTKYILFHLKRSKSHFANINTIIISNANTVNFATTYDHRKDYIPCYFYQEFSQEPHRGDRAGKEWNFSLHAQEKENTRNDDYSIEFDQGMIQIRSL